MFQNVKSITLATSDWLLEAVVRLPPEEPPPPPAPARAAVMVEVAVEAELEAEVVDDPCFCCLRENALVLSLEKSRLFRSLLAGMGPVWGRSWKAKKIHEKMGFLSVCLRFLCHIFSLWIRQNGRKFTSITTQRQTRCCYLPTFLFVASLRFPFSRLKLF